MYISYTRHVVKDYAQWRRAFDGNTHMLLESGIKEWTIVQINGSSTDIAVICHCPGKKNWDDFMAAHQIKGPEFLTKMLESGGVVGQPDWWGGEAV